MPASATELVCCAAVLVLATVYDVLILAGAGRYLAGSFLSEENKIMIELKQAAEQRSAKAEPRSQKSANAPFSWILPQLRRDW